MRINVTRSSMPTIEEYVSEISDIWDSHWLTNMGEKHNALEKELESFLNVPHVSLYTNGHLALENIITALDMKKGGEIITTPFTFASTTHAIVRTGFSPIFCDINPENYTIDVEKIEELITDKTVAIIPVHVYGNMCDVEKIERIASAYNLKVIYDSAHAFGVKYKGVSSACFGDATMYSFHATKVFNTIEGGAVCYHQDNLVRKLNDLRDFGIRSEEDVGYIGGNAKMNEFQAAMGLCNLRHFNEEIEKRRNVVLHYRERLRERIGIKLCNPQEDVEPNYAYFPVVFDKYKYSRDEIYRILKENGIGARKYFYPLTNSFSCYSDLKSAGIEKTPIAAYIAEKVLTLPLYADLNIKDVDIICDLILS
ncbi:dTDP-4-amino-4,6-dideoxygalactose transaminase [Lachnospiraceae bacterium G41]|nr:dTDP-4-amino-4,6-dideoxygalactose transaminase [Lachnospiraceae bacterium G41]